MNNIANYQELASAIILTAVKDYKRAYEKRDQNKLRPLRKFFKSSYFDVLSDLDGDVLMKKIEAEVDNERKGSVKRSISHRA